MQHYATSLTDYKRLPTQAVRIGELYLGADYPIRIQTMTTTDTMDTEATLAQTIRCIEAGAELVRITAPSIKEAQNLENIKNELNKRGYYTPLVADIHFTPNAAEVAAKIVEKVRINPGNYVDKKKFETHSYTDDDYQQEIDRIYKRFLPLLNICKQNNTAIRIGTNHGSLSDRIVSRYGDSPMGMVESAMEFLRIARAENFHQLILSMKSSNPIVMVQAYRLLAKQMFDEFGMYYPLHLGVTEAGDGEDGRIKSGIGIGTLLEDGIGDTIRVSLTEEPEFEIPVAKDIVNKYSQNKSISEENNTESLQFSYNPFSYSKQPTLTIKNIGGENVPIVVADFMQLTEPLTANHLSSIGYTYDETLDKWHTADQAADYAYVAKTLPNFATPSQLGIIADYDTWLSNSQNHQAIFPLIQAQHFNQNLSLHPQLNFVSVDVAAKNELSIEHLRQHTNIVLVLYSTQTNALQKIRLFSNKLQQQKILFPLIIGVESHSPTIDEQLIDFSITAGGIFIDGFGNGIWLMNDANKLQNIQMQGRTYLPIANNLQFINNTAFSILQATRTRISKTEYISCPSCGRTLFDLQETTAKIRHVTHHLKGVKIAIMGCIVNGPGEMADADFGYVGSGVNKISLYKGKEVVRKNIDSEQAVEELIALLKENNAWVEPATVNT